MVRIGLISNVCSERNKRRMQAIDRTVAGIAGLRHEKICAVDGLADILASFAADKVEAIAVNSGDGTIHAVLTVLLEQRPFAKPPPVCVLMGGMANMTGADVAPKAEAPAVLRRLAGLIEAGAIHRHLIHRHVLRLENIAGQPPQRAMFFGAAGIVEAIRLCKTEMHARGLSAAWANWATLLKMLAGWAVSGEGNRRNLGAEMAVALDNAPAVEGRRLIVLATTLDKLILRSRPFWNTAGGTLRFTEIAYPAKRLLLNAPRVLYGRSDRSIRDGSYRSRGVRRAVLALDGPFTLDGQFFTARRDHPLVITADDRVAFVKF
ncbi:MAG: diacylglycerol kinase family protein [Rhodospirillales bacterium]